MCNLSRKVQDEGVKAQKAAANEPFKFQFITTGARQSSAAAEEKISIFYGRFSFHPNYQDVWPSSHQRGGTNAARGGGGGGRGGGGVIAGH